MGSNAAQRGIGILTGWFVVVLLVVVGYVWQYLVLYEGGLLIARRPSQAHTVCAWAAGGLGLAAGGLMVLRLRGRWLPGAVWAGLAGVCGLVLAMGLELVWRASQGLDDQSWRLIRTVAWRGEHVDWYYVPHPLIGFSFLGLLVFSWVTICLVRPGRLRWERLGALVLAWMMAACIAALWMGLGRPVYMG